MEPHVYVHEINNVIAAHNAPLSDAWIVDVNIPRPLNNTTDTKQLLALLHRIVVGCTNSIKDADLRNAANVTFYLYCPCVKVRTINNTDSSFWCPIVDIFDDAVYPSEYADAQAYENKLNAIIAKQNFAAVAAAARATAKNNLPYIPQELWSLIFTF